MQDKIVFGPMGSVGRIMAGNAIHPESSIWAFGVCDVLGYTCCMATGTIYN